MTALITASLDGHTGVTHVCITLNKVGCYAVKLPKNTLLRRGLVTSAVDAFLYFNPDLHRDYVELRVLALAGINLLLFKERYNLISSWSEV